MLGVDLDGEDCDDRILGPKKPKGGKVALKSDSEYKFEDEEELRPRKAASVAFVAAGLAAS